MTTYPGTRPANDDVVAALSILDGHVDQLEQEDPGEQAANRTYARWNRLTFVLLGADLLASVVQGLRPFPAFDWMYAILFGSAIGVSLVAHVQHYRAQEHTLRALREPRRALLSNLKRRLDLEDARVSELLTHTLATLQFTRARLAQAAEIHKERSEATFGAAGKIGLFPGILAAGAALIPLVKGGPLWAQVLAIVVTSLIVLNQNTATTLHMGLADTRLMLGLLDRAIAIKEEEAQSLSRAATSSLR